MEKIEIKEETWKKLMMKKMYSSQTFDTIINNLLEEQNLNLKEEVTEDAI